MLSFFTETIMPIISNIGTNEFIVIGIFFLAILTLLNLLSKNNAFKITIVFVLYVILVSALSILLKLQTIEYLLLIVSFIICVVVMFSTEIKRNVWIRKNPKIVSTDVASAVRSSQQIVNKNINEIIKALQNMSKNDVGAILVFSNTKIPTSIIDSGVKIDSDISSALIESIFFPKTPLHDGAIIIQNDKIQAAGCFLPLSQETDLPKELGTRHRAGLGVTEVLNVTAIIVSEETGIISIAKGGKITRYADSEMLRKTLKEYYWQDLIGTTKEGKNNKGGLI